ncbi:MAG TPA: GTP cyclohydrolase I, partial [Myxococcaceae bacterium]|nr:GTP cyclohydrolase I [Myxococcaceae bacterium]
MARSPRPRRRPNAARQAAVRKATSALLLGLGVRTTGDWKQTPARVASLWTDQLLAGEQLDPAEVLGGAMRHRGRTPVAVRDIGLHMVCPHHLTVALGRAHVAYAPEDRLAGLGQLSDLVKACTARFVLQEEAVQDICDALVEHLHARAAVATI